jgi:site-specific DNA-adenine methylase
VRDEREYVIRWLRWLENMQKREGASEIYYRVRNREIAVPQGPRFLYLVGTSFNGVRRYDGEFPKRYFREFLDYCDITETQFWEVADSWRSPHLWEKAGGEWTLRHRVS